MTPYFDRIVCISLRRREDRRERLLSHLAAISWPWQMPEFFMAVDGRAVPIPDGWTAGAGAYGCMQSHRHVLEQALTDGVNRLLVLEDDVFFVEDFATSAVEFVSAVPDDWEQMMIGGQFQNRGRPYLYEPLNETVYRVAGVERTHAYAVQGDFIGELYAKLRRSAGHCDHIIGPFQHGRRVFAPKQWLAGQSEGKSDIGREFVARRWVAPDIELPVTWIRGKDPMRDQGYHSGNWRNEHGVCRGLAEIAGMDFDQAVAKLKRWVQMIRWEAASPSPELKPAIWCPALDEKVIRAACPNLLLEPVEPVETKPAPVKKCCGAEPATLEDPRKWGPIKWQEWHAEPDTIVDLDPGTERERIAAFIKSLPCQDCRRDFTAIVEANPPAFRSMDEHRWWKIERHNDVNRKLGKRVLSIEEAEAAIERNRPRSPKELDARYDICRKCEHHIPATRTGPPVCRLDEVSLKEKVRVGQCEKWLVHAPELNSREFSSAPGVTVFWHVAAMNHWILVAEEQLALLASVGLRSVRCTVLGQPSDIDFLHTMAAKHGVTLHIERTAPEIELCETPAMLAIEQWAKTNDGPVLYLHTKGVSAPWNAGKEAWREQMQRETVARWRETLPLLANYDVIGCNWNPGTNWKAMGGHMAGNFWLTTGVYLRKLPAFASYYAQRSVGRWACEDWIGRANPRWKELASWEPRFVQ